MAISSPDYNAVQTAGNTGTVVNSITPTAVAGMSAQITRAFVLVGHTHNMGSTPAGWTAAFTNLSLALTGTLGSAAGPRLVSLYYRDRLTGDTWTMPSFSMVSALNGTMALASFGLDKTDARYAWNTPTWTTTGAVDTTSNTAFSTGASSGMATHVGGMLMAAVVNNTGATFTPTAFTHTGTTATLTERGDAGLTTGFDCGLSYLTGIPSASSGAANTFAMTGTHSGSTRAGVVFIEQTEGRVSGGGLDTLVEDFSPAPLDPAIWVPSSAFSWSDGTAASAFGLNNVAGYIVSTKVYDFTSKSMHWQLAPATTALSVPVIGLALTANGTAFSGLREAATTAKRWGFQFTISGSQYRYQCWNATAGLGSVVNFDPLAVCFRMREASGTVYWEISTDFGGNWTTAQSTASHTISDKTKMEAYFEAFEPDTGEQSAMGFDSINDTLSAWIHLSELTDDFNTGSVPDPVKWSSTDDTLVGGKLELGVTAVVTSYGQLFDSVSFQAGTGAIQVAVVLPALGIDGLAYVALDGGGNATLYGVDATDTEQFVTYSIGDYFKIDSTAGYIEIFQAANPSAGGWGTAVATFNSAPDDWSGYPVVLYIVGDTGATLDNINLLPPPPKIETFTENFNSTGGVYASGAWTQNTSIDNIGVWAGFSFQESGPWDWYESSVSFEILGAYYGMVTSSYDYGGGSGGPVVGLQPGVDGVGNPGVQLAFGDNTATYGVDWFSVDYDPVAHRCVRIRQNTDFTIDYDVSPDGSTWTEIFSAPGPGEAVSSNMFSFTGLFVVFAIDNINLPPTSPVPPVGTVVEKLRTFVPLSSSDSTGSPYTIPMNLGVGADALILLASCALANTLPVVTYGGVSVPILANTADANYKYAVYGLLNPAAGDQDMVATTTGLTTWLEAYSFSGVTALGNTVATNDGGGTVTTKLGDLVLFGQLLDFSGSLITAHNTYTPLLLLSDTIGGPTGLDWHTSSLVLPDNDAITLAVNLVSGGDVNTGAFFFMG